MDDRHVTETHDGPTDADRTRTRCGSDNASGSNTLFLVVAGLFLATVLALAVGFVYLAGVGGLALVAGVAVPAALVAWLVDRLTRAGDPAEGRSTPCAPDRPAPPWQPHPPGSEGFHPRSHGGLTARGERHPPRDRPPASDGAGSPRLG